MHEVINIFGYNDRPIFILKFINILAVCILQDVPHCIRSAYNVCDVITFFKNFLLSVVYICSLIISFKTFCVINGYMSFLV